MTLPRPYNFSAGPSILPAPVLERASAAVRELDIEGDPSLEARLSILEISHRSKTFDAIHERAIERVHRVLGVPRTHKVLFLQGGATLQFAMVPLNLRREGEVGAYIDTGAWSHKAIAESRRSGPTRVVASSEGTRFDRIPPMPGADTYADASYLHITTNNTIYGTEYADLPVLDASVPLVADLSSNVGSRAMPLERLALGYAGAQKNLGPSGLVVAFVESSLLEREVPPTVPSLLTYAAHAASNSLLNTPNTFGILVLDLVLEWLEEQGGVDAMGSRNALKAEEIYRVIDRSSLYRGHAEPASRSKMNVSWTLAGEDQAEIDGRTRRFLAASIDAGLCGLKGHRSVGGCRASIYNAFPMAGVQALCEFMREFERRGG